MIFTIIIAVSLIITLILFTRGNTLRQWIDVSRNKTRPDRRQEGDAQQEAKDEDDGEEEENTGIDLDELNKRFSAVKRLYNKSEKVIASKGRTSPEALKELDKLGETFKFLKLSPKKFEVISLRPRIMARQVREAERQIYNLCVQKSKMPRKEFLDLFKE